MGTENLTVKTPAQQKEEKSISHFHFHRALKVFLIFIEKYFSFSLKSISHFHFHRALN